MTTGALIFAYNNEEVDYLSLAQWSARNIQRHLGIPVAVVTDRAEAKTMPEFAQVIDETTTSDNHRYFHEYRTTLTWYNGNRMDAYRLSPWQQTLVLDADYVVASNMLQTVLDSNQNFLAHRWACDITEKNNFSGNNFFGNYRMPMWWATVMMFRRSTEAEQIFSVMNMVKQNWTHYRQLYSNSRNTYRNDHALSIALNLVNGNNPNQLGIPWPLVSVIPGTTFQQLDADCYRLEYTASNGKKKYMIVQNQDLHVIEKQQLGEIVAS